MHTSTVLCCVARKYYTIRFYVTACCCRFAAAHICQVTHTQRARRQSIVSSGSTEPVAIPAILINYTVFVHHTRRRRLRVVRVHASSPPPASQRPANARIVMVLGIHYTDREHGIEVVAI